MPRPQGASCLRCSFFFLLVLPTVPQRGRSAVGGDCGRAMTFEVVGQQRLILDREVRLERPLDPRFEIDAEFLCEIEEVTAGMAVALGELRDQLLDAGRQQGDGLLPLTLPQRDLFAECA